MYVHIYGYICVYLYMYIAYQSYHAANRHCLSSSEFAIRLLLLVATEWRRHIVCLIFTGQFPQTSPMISGFCAN